MQAVRISSRKLKGRKKQLLESNENNLEEYKDKDKTLFYMFWNNNRNTDFSYLPPTIFVEEEAECLQRLPKVEVNSRKDMPPQDHQE